MATQRFPEFPLVRVDAFPDIGRAVVANSPLAAGTVALAQRAPLRSSPTVFTIEVSPTAHADVTAPLMFTAHSCGPAARIEHGPVPPLDVPGAEVELSLVAIRDVAAGEVLSFDYDSTEWEMAEPFDCRCGADVCRGRVEGFKLLAARDPETARGLLKHASDHIKAMAAVEMPQLVAED